MVVEDNYATKEQDLFSTYKLTDEDKEEIKNLSKDPYIREWVSGYSVNASDGNFLC